MSNIFNVADNLKLRSRIQQLNADAKPAWGKMNAAQMVLHCQKPLDVASGKLLLKQGLIGFLFGKMAKRDFLNKPEFTRNLPTAPEFKIKSIPDFDSESQTLLLAVTRFGDVGPSIITNITHPFFGTMTEEEWGILQFKHLDHHLKQFGV